MQGAGEQERQPIPPEPEKQVNKKGQAVGLRWLTALIAMPLVLIFVWFGGWFSFAATLFVVVLGLRELHGMFTHAGYRPLFWISLGLSTIFLLAAMFPLQRALILDIGVAAALLITFLWLFFRQQLDGSLIDWALTLVIPLYLAWPMSFFLLMRGYQPGTLQPTSDFWMHLPRGGWWLVATFLGVWGFDACAFFSGLYFGRHKLAPRISPGKTWEGVAGGLILCIISCLLVTVVPLGVPWYLAIVLGILISAAAVIGDLAESLIKRQAHVKDSGQIMPGHGGMLDRIDSLLFVVIVVYLFSQFIGK
ncbi:MAG TPA: CDP-archaeol synthase [Ktedonobacteraceae bacterium]|nr:CDP-archaeol synthase [Ktedonobacteraceae bacterium]